MADSLNRRVMPRVSLASPAFAASTSTLMRMVRMVRLALMALISLMAVAGTTTMSAHAAEPGAGGSFSSGGTDPTRPPANLLVPEPAPGADGTDPASAELAQSGLQSVILREGAKPMAIINGQAVSLGGRVGDARLVSLTETAAVLQGPNGKEVIRLTPHVEITPVVMSVSRKIVKHPVSKKKKIKKRPKLPEQTPEQNPN